MTGIAAAGADEPDPGHPVVFGGLLDLDRAGPWSFRAGGHGRTGADRAFGGAALAQALLAAGRTVAPDRAAHSLHAYFVRGADATAPIDYRVEPIRDGGSYTTRSVTATQDGADILRLMASFQVPEDGLEHQVPVLDAPAPDACTTVAEATAAATGPARDFLARLPHRHPLELRFAAELPRLAAARGEAAPPRQRLWLRSSGPLPDDALLHTCALAYASDVLLLSASLAPHGTVVGAPGVTAASLDHAVWFHRPIRMDRWLFFDQESPTAAGGRGLGRTRVHDEAGHLVATVVQEGMIRRRPERG